MGYQPIGNYGVIGNMHSIALVGMNGSIDWLCLPRFDAPSIFAAILDDAKGGRFQVCPTDTCNAVTHKQFYWPDTNILVTRFVSGDGIGEVVDFMPVAIAPGEPGYHWLVRRVSVERGTMTFNVQCEPAFNYARDDHTTTLTDYGVRFAAAGMDVELASSVPLAVTNGGVAASYTLNEGEHIHLVLRQVDNDTACHQPIDPALQEHLFHHTIAYWRRWISKCTYLGRWSEMVRRSALVLKLMTYEPTGAIVAAPTTSLPEGIGGERNWDYRYTWIRDAAFTVYGLMRIGLTEEAAAFMQWIEARTHEARPDGSLQLMYGIGGEHHLPEYTLDHLEGYAGSRPVRIGNAAYDQLQLDIYGELMDSAYLYNKYGVAISYDMWCQLRRLIDWVCEHWDQPDEGIWEVRGGRQNFVYSRLMCWVALDRGVRLADKRSFPADRERWLRVRDTIYEQIMAHGWSETRQAFVQAYGSDALDAANLLMPLVFFMSPADPRMLATLRATNRSLSQGGLRSGGQIYRYDVSRSPDGLRGEEGTFNICTFWMVEAMTRAGTAQPEWLEEARLMFEQMLGYANHVGLYAEETGMSGEALGNFPQAFTHLSLISAAFNLDRALGRRF